MFGNSLLDDGTPYLTKPFAREELAARVRELLAAPEAAGA